MAIRPRVDSGWHDYSQVFSDLRSGRLTYAEYETMVDEDRLEMGRRLFDEALGLADEARSLMVDAHKKYSESQVAEDSAVTARTAVFSDVVTTGGKVMIARYPDKIKGLCAPTTDPFLKRED